MSLNFPVYKTIYQGQGMTPLPVVIILKSEINPETLTLVSNTI